MLLVGVGTAVAQQLSGTDALFYNYVKAADAVGFSRLWKVYATLVGFGTCKLITAFASMYLLDTVGTCVEIKFGRPTPSTRCCTYNCVWSMAWRFTKVSAIFLRIT